MFRLGIAAAVVTLALAVAAGTYSLASSTASTTFTSIHGYQLVLADGWRRSTTLSIEFASGPNASQEVFTVRSQADEAAALSAPGQEATFSAAWQYTVVVRAYPNPTNQTAQTWTSDLLHTGWARGQVVQSLTFDGRSAVRIVGGTRYSVVYYVPAAGEMFEVGVKADLPMTAPAAATRSAVDGIAGSFHLTKP